MKKLELVVNNVKSVVVNKKVAVGAALMVASVSPAFADGITDAITAATTSGQANVSLTVAGLIGMAALGFGVTMIVGFLRK
ncbi:conserved exported hypothetical protein [Vibrio harveyi]|uniref:hypothetical protein n=1 Tax=Vibrio harveyi TaxID=669 RepID=UPI002893D112|nr:conserved exported hypothetical protein [Vibrio harveyi]